MRLPLAWHRVRRQHALLRRAGAQRLFLLPRPLPHRLSTADATDATAVKFYKRDPDRALAGMSELNPGQRGIYNSIIDLLYARDGIVPCITVDDDYRIAKNISVAAQTWRTYKRQLMALGKIRITTDGRLDANGVTECRNSAETHSETQRKRVSIRWQNYKLRKQFNDRAIRASNTIDRDSKSSEIPSPIEHAKPLAVDNGDNSIGAESETTTKCAATSEELKANIQRKWLGR
jgi:hypothetical protein